LFYAKCTKNIFKFISFSANELRRGARFQWERRGENCMPGHGQSAALQRLEGVQDWRHQGDDYEYVINLIAHLSYILYLFFSLLSLSLSVSHLVLFLFGFAL